jgi:hypothetical protein
MSFDKTKLKRILWDIRRADLVSEVLIVIFYTVLPEYLKKKKGNCCSKKITLFGAVPNVTRSKSSVSGEMY